MKTKPLLLLLFSITSSVSYAQNCRQTVSYDSHTQTLYNFAKDINTSTIPAQEFLSFKPTEVDNHFEEFFTYDNKYTRTIIHGKTTEYPDWVTVPSETVYDLTDIKVYNQNGVITQRIPYSEKALEYNKKRILTIQEKGLFPVPDFSLLSKTEIAALQLRGTNITTSSDGAYHIKSSNKEYIINPALYTTSLVEYDNNQNEQYRMDETFIRNKYGQFIPYEKAEAYNLKTTNYISYQKVIYTVFSNFKRGGSDPLYNPIVSNPIMSNSNVFGSNIKAYPNPTNDIINVEIPTSNSLDNQFVNISIENVYGQVVRSAAKQASGNTFSFSLAGLLSGTYSIKVIWSNGAKSINILKM